MTGRACRVSNVCVVVGRLRERAGSTRLTSSASPFQGVILDTLGRTDSTEEEGVKGTCLM